MTCPRCKCPDCRAAAVNAVLVRVVVSRETAESTPRDVEVPSVDQHNAAAIRDNQEREQWRDTFEPRRSGRFVEKREKGKVPVDPDAEQLVADVVREMARAG